MKLSYGELLDRFSILQIKRYLADESKAAAIAAQLNELIPEISEHDRATLELAVLNAIIFMCVGAIVKETDLEVAGRLGKNIQALNQQRSNCKNAIDAKSGYQDIKI